MPESPLGEVFGPFESRNAVQTDRLAVSLLQHALLREQLDRAIAGPVDADLSTGEKAVPHLQAHLRAAIDPEEIRYEVAEVATAKLTGEAVGDAKRPLVARHPER